MFQPLRKQSGDTHIRYLLPEIKQAICNELSLEKYTGKRSQTNEFYK